MPSPFLGLPRELRDQIYSELMTSPSGYIRPSKIFKFYEKDTTFHCHEAKIFPGSRPARSYKEMIEEGPRMDRPSLAYTCKQVQAEMTEIMDRFLFRNNTFFFRPDDNFLLSPPDAIHKIEHIHLDITLPAINKPDPLRSTFAKLEDLASNGSLKSLSITPLSSLVHLEIVAMSQTSRMPTGMIVLFRFINLLSDFSYSGGLSCINRKILLDWSWKTPATDAQHRWVRECDSPGPVPAGNHASIGAGRVLSFLAAAFRCGLWVNGTLCFDDNAQIANPFPLEPIERLEEAKEQVQLVVSDGKERNLDSMLAVSEAVPRASGSKMPGWIRRGRGLP